MMGSEQIKDAAIKYDKPTLARMVQMGQLDARTALMAGMMRDRIVQAEMKPPSPPTVVEEVMQPMGQRMGAPQQVAAAGISQIPVPESMFEEPQEMAEGGIIAFQNRGLVEDEFDYGAATSEIDAASGRNLTGKFSGLGDAARILAEERNKFLGPNQSVADLIAYNKEAEARAAARSKQQFNVRLLEAGLATMGGTSPYAFENIGKGATAAAKGLSEDIAKQEEAKETRKKSELAAKGIERRENEASFSQALAQINAEVEADAKLKAANVAAGKPTDMRNYVNDVELAAKGDLDAKRRVEAVEKYLPLATLARTGVAAEAVDVQRDKLSAQNLKVAQDFASQQIGAAGNKRAEYRKLKKQDRANEQAGNPTTLADDFEKQIVRDFLSELERRNARGAPSAPTASTASAAPTAARTPPAGRGIPKSRPDSKLSPPPAAISMLKSNNTSAARQQFDAVFGAGAADRAVPSK